jgi:hypothetical protein
METVRCFYVANKVTGVSRRIMAQSKWAAIADAVRKDLFSYSAKDYTAKPI